MSHTRVISPPYKSYWLQGGTLSNKETSPLNCNAIHSWRRAASKGKALVKGKEGGRGQKKVSLAGHWSLGHKEMVRDIKNQTAFSSLGPMTKDASNFLPRPRHLNVDRRDHLIICSPMCPFSLLLNLVSLRNWTHSHTQQKERNTRWTHILSTQPHSMSIFLFLPGYALSHFLSISFSLSLSLSQENGISVEENSFLKLWQIKHSTWTSLNIEEVAINKQSILKCMCT